MQNSCLPLFVLFGQERSVHAEAWAHDEHPTSLGLTALRVKLRPTPSRGARVDLARSVNQTTFKCKLMGAISYRTLTRPPYLGLEVALGYYI